MACCYPDLMEQRFHTNTFKWAFPLPFRRGKTKLNLSSQRPLPITENSITLQLT